MFRNNFKTAFRNLWKNKGFSAINIVGLASGLATCLLIFFYVTDEMSYDLYNKNADRIFRVDGDINFGGNHFILALAPAPMGPALKQDYPEVEQVARFRNYGGFLVKKGAQNIQENKVIYADSTLFQVFTLPMLSGDPSTALSAPHSLVITEKMAIKYFKSRDIIGRNLIINDSVNYTITGVIKNLPAQSHIDFDFFVAMAESEESRRYTEWLSNNFNTYVLLKKGADPKKLEAKFGDMVNKYDGPLVKSILNTSMAEVEKSGNFIRYSLTPLIRIHLYSNKVAELGVNSSIQYVYIFSAIALFILLIACVNFMNLSTARSSNRAREVGVRKVLGSLRVQLITQFLTESTLLSFLSMILALLFAWLLLPFFNQLAGKEMSLGLLSKPGLIPLLLLLVMLVGLMAGCYPAFYLSAFLPVKVLKGTLAAGFRTGLLRSILVVFQFGISIFLIVGTLVIQNQLSFIRNKKLGYDRDHVLIVENSFVLGKQARAFKEDVLQMGGVEGATMTGFLPTSDNRNDNTFFLSPNLDQKTAISLQNWPIDENYLPVLGMKLAKGRNFSAQFPSDSDAVLINEAAAKLMGFKDAINQKLYDLVDLKTKEVRPYTIIGIVKDFNFNSLRDQVTPMGMFLHEDRGNIAVRINSHDIPRLIRQVENKWKIMAPGQPFSYSFMDDDFNALYKSEQRMGKISLSFSVLAICIACLGLFGLAAYAAEQRTKEIGIRKVLGASVGHIFKMLSGDFLKLVLISAIIAFPFAWWAMHGWLQDFAYRVFIGWEVFLVAALLAVSIALLTVSLQAIKAAWANPVKSLRAE